ncbi:MAG: CAP domain-containing protein [Acidobacteria bacterium]|nr:CAP domain-containing protein [Acidobacteriota bacterium]
MSLRAGGMVIDRVPAMADTAITPAAVRALEKDAFQLINTERALAGLSALKWSDKVADVARLHSNNMADYDFFSHKGLDGLMVDERAAQLKMGAWKAIGENIAFMKGYEHPVATAVEKWLQSPSHKKNLLDPDWTETAIGLAVTADGKYYFTQVFIR